MVVISPLILFRGAPEEVDGGGGLQSSGAIVFS